MNQTKSVLLVGVGGQGAILVAKILVNGLMQAGYDVKMSEVHGMSQRGGSVITHVRIAESGEKVYSPLVEQKGADVIVAFERLEALRALPYLKEGGSIVLNDQKILPMPVITGAMEYPADALERVKASANVIAVDALGAARACGTGKAANIVLLGVLSRLLPYSVERWEEAIRACVKPAFLDVNLKAFETGRQLG